MNNENTAAGRQSQLELPAWLQHSPFTAEQRLLIRDLHVADNAREVLDFDPYATDHDRD